MKLINKLLYALSIILLSIVSGCNEVETFKLEGNIVGFVELIDENGELVKDKSNVTVSLNNKLSVTTDPAGRFEFSDVGAGTYRVMFEKEGYGSFKEFNFIFAGGNRPGLMYPVQLFQIPSITVNNFQVNKMTDHDAIQVSGSLQEGDKHFLAFYFSKNKNVSNENYEFSSVYSYCCTTPPPPLFTHSIFIPEDILLTTDKLYMSAYAVNGVYGNQSYYDYELEKWISTAVQKIAGPLEVPL